MIRNRTSWLDHLVFTFQHRWETNAQYRAAVSGFVGLALIVTMCACTGVVSAATSAALAGIGLGGSPAGPSSGGKVVTGTKLINGAKSFPTSTVVLTPGTVPGASQLPNSQTPAPHPTAVPTATSDTSTPTATPPGGSVTTCNGNQGTATWVLNPCPLTHGQSGTLTIVDKRHPGASTNVVIDFCAASSCALVFPPNGGYKLDGSGRETISFVVPAQAANSTTPISGFIQITGGPTMSINAAPVQ